MVSNQNDGCGWTLHDLHLWYASRFMHLIFIVCAACGIRRASRIHHAACCRAAAGDICPAAGRASSSLLQRTSHHVQCSNALAHA
jgi:hypothetical protein